MPLVLVVLAFLYPNYVEQPAGRVPGVGTLVIMLVFTMMAVGLNIVVGYAGLLDLGYVAFYAVGAYTAAWFASLQFEQVTLPLRLGRDQLGGGRDPPLDLARAR